MNRTRSIDLIQERRRVVQRQYASGGWLIALVTLTIEIEGVPLVIPAGHRLSCEEALNYPGDVQPAFNQRQIQRRVSYGPSATHQG